MRVALRSRLILAAVAAVCFGLLVSSVTLGRAEAREELFLRLHYGAPLMSWALDAEFPLEGVVSGGEILVDVSGGLITLALRQRPRVCLVGEICFRNYPLARVISVPLVRRTIDRCGTWTYLGVAPAEPESGPSESIEVRDIAQNTCGTAAGGAATEIDVFQGKRTEGGSWVVSKASFTAAPLAYSSPRGLAAAGGSPEGPELEE
jgi:hypothetical protein